MDPLTNRATVSATHRSQNRPPKTTTSGPDQAADFARQWVRVRGQLRSVYGEAEFRSWLKPLEFMEGGAQHVTLGVPTRFMRDWIVNNYGDRIAQLWQAESGRVLKLDIVTLPSAAPRQARDNGARPNGSGPNGAGDEQGRDANAHDEGEDSHVYGTGLAADMPADLGVNGHDAADAIDQALVGRLDPRFRFENFVVGKPNELAYAAARRIAGAPPNDVPFNPLFLYGGVGLGKTHLMHAIAWEMRTRFPDRKVLYLSAEKFMYQFVRALRFKDTVAFKDQFRSVDVLMIDDIQFISGKESTQEEFFHTFNELVDRNRQVIVSADKSPANLTDMEERMKSRLGWGLVADIHPTDYELRLGILQAIVERHPNVEVPQKVLEFLAHRITANVRELEGAMIRLFADATLVGRRIDLDSTQDVLRDLLRANDRRLTIEDIQKRVAEHYNIRFTDMHSARRSRAIARPRQIAMYFCKQLTSRSLPEIGRKFGGRDHTTVIHAVRKVDELRGTDAGFAEDLDLLRRMLEVGTAQH